MCQVLYKAGPPDSFKWEDRPVGDPGPGQVRLKHSAIGLNFAETQIRAGKRPYPLPGVIGGEGAGVVSAVGPGVTGFKAGDRVVYWGPQGSYSQERLIQADALYPLPKGVPDDVAAASMLKGLTAHYLVHRTFPVKKGHTILYHAAAGGVGLLACQWAKHYGATVIGTVSSEAKAKVARAHGCDHVVIYKDGKFADQVKALTGGRGVDAVFDAIGVTTFDDSMASTAVFGTIVLFGNPAGDVTPEQYARIPLDRYFVHPTLPAYMAKKEDRDRSVRELLGAIEQGVLKVEVRAHYPLKDVARAHTDLEGRRPIGASVLAP
jgi:NADPH2:quinone reductase